MGKNRKSVKKGGVQSVENAAKILRLLGSAPGPLMLKELARAADMSPSHAHGYLVSLVRTGLAQQDDVSQRYDLGPLVLRLGIRALYRLDYVKVSADAAQRLKNLTDFSVLMAVWGDRGPTIIEFHRSFSRPLPMTVYAGSTLSLLSTAAGRIFLAYLPRQMTAIYVADELKVLAKLAQPSPFKNRADVEKLIDRIRSKGLARAEGVLLPGQIAVCAPIFDRGGRVVAAISITAVGGQEEFRDNAVAVQHLQAVTADASHRLGYNGKPVIVPAYR